MATEIGGKTIGNWEFIILVLDKGCIAYFRDRIKNLRKEAELERLNKEIDAFLEELQQENAIEGNINSITQYFF